MNYNPQFVQLLSAEERVGLLAHEVMHNAMGHFARRDGRDVADWNLACDLAVNPLLRDAGVALPADGVFPGQDQYSDLEDGLSAEEYYTRLPQRRKQSKEDRAGEGQGHGSDPGRCGGVADASDPARATSAQAEWQVAVTQAATAAKQRGEMPGGLGRFAQQTVHSQVTWQEELREFVSRTLSAHDDYSWGAPNRRFIAQGLYLPSLRSESLGDIVVAIDTSGSINAETLAAFGGELNGILECRPCSVTVLYCDAAINKVQQWEPADGPLTLDAVGGGGTSHAPIWAWLTPQGAAPECVVCLTDGYTDFGEAPGVPVLWAITPDGASQMPPFGRVVRM